MTLWRLKEGQEAITCMDGPLAKRKFKPGREYDEIPTQDRHRFEKVPVTAQARQKKDKKKADTPGEVVDQIWPEPEKTTEEVGK